MKTAVEWLFEQLDISQGYESAIDILQQAKEMEKQQMREASCPYVGGWEDDDFEYWYNETYKNTEQ
jgi:hypothetical protein